MRVRAIIAASEGSWQSETRVRRARGEKPQAEDQVRSSRRTSMKR
jgi:hypothetical protein